MKKLIAAMVVVVGITSCGGRTIVIEKTASTDAPEITVAKTSPAETAAPKITDPAQTPEEQFISSLMVEYSWVVNNMGRVKLVDLGKLICQAIDEGMSFSDYLELILAYNIDAGAGGAILRESIYNFCAGEQWFLDAAIDELSRS